MSASVYFCALALFILHEFSSSVAAAADVGIRRDVLELSATEKEALLQGFYTMKATPSKYDASFSSYEYFAWVHRWAVDHNEDGAFGHNRWNFLPWHRGFLYLFEKDLQQAMNDDTARLPYWDLSNEDSASAILDDESLFGGWGDANNSNMLPDSTRLSCEDWPIDFRLINHSEVENYTCLTREIELHPLIKELPAADEWFSILEEGMDYDVDPYDDYIARQQNTTQNLVQSYRARIEGMFGLYCNESAYSPVPRIEDIDNMCPFMHNQVHSYIGGHMTSSASPIDPLFFLLHGWIDVMWALYQDEYGLEYTFPEQFKAVPFFDGFFNDSQMSSNDVMDTTQLGYVYEIQLELMSTTRGVSQSSTMAETEDESAALPVANSFDVVVITVVASVALMAFV